MTSQAKMLAAARGVAEDESAQHLSRLLTPDLLRSADLILAMTREHRRDVVEMEPARLKRVFTIREFARLAEGVPDTDFAGPRVTGAVTSRDEPGRRFDDVLALIAARRGISFGPAIASDDDVVDPYRQPMDVYERCGQELDPAIAAVERVVRLSTRDD